MKLIDIIPAWARILSGHKPFLSIEITRECPLRCPGCYAYEPNHLGAGNQLRQLADFDGERLVAAVLALVRRLRPLHLSIVGGEPLVRYRELGILLPQLEQLGVEVQFVTSAVRKIWFSLFTPQEKDSGAERLTIQERHAVLAELAELRHEFPKIYLPNAVLNGYYHPPASPQECIFAQTTDCISADLATRITPCQFGGRPRCPECGCVASAGLASIGRYKLGGIVPVSAIFPVSKKVGERFHRNAEASGTALIRKTGREGIDVPYRRKDPGY